MKRLTDREQIEFLMAYLPSVGHTKGTPFEEATLTLDSGRPFDIYSMKEILELLHHMNIVAATGAVSPTDKFVYIWLKHHGIIDAFSYLNEYVNS